MNSKKLLELAWSTLKDLPPMDLAYVFAQPADKDGRIDIIALRQKIPTLAGLRNSDVSSIRTRQDLLRAARRAKAKLEKKPGNVEIGREGARLIRSGSTEIGMLLVGYAYDREYNHISRLCSFCFRHAAPGGGGDDDPSGAPRRSRYCEVHRPQNGKSRSDYMAARRVKFKKGGERFLENSVLVRLKVRYATEAEVLAKLGIAYPPDPEGWKSWRSEMIQKFQWLPSKQRRDVLALDSAISWVDTVNRLRKFLSDPHCPSLDLKVWRSKIKAADHERRWAAIWRHEGDRRRSKLTHKILLLKKKKLTDSEVADDLKVYRGTISKRISLDPELEEFRASAAPEPRKRTTH